MECPWQAMYQFWPDEVAPVFTAKHYTVHLLGGGKEEEGREEASAEESAGGVAKGKKGSERRNFRVEHCTVSEQFPVFLAL